MNIFKEELLKVVDDVLCDICNKSCKHEINFESAIKKRRRCLLC